MDTADRNVAEVDSGPTDCAIEATSGDEVTMEAGGEGSGSGSSGGGKAGRDRVKGPWSPEEDAVLSQLVQRFGPRNWSLIARGISGRSGKSCRLRWCNQLDPAVKRKPFTGNLAIWESDARFFCSFLSLHSFGFCHDKILHDHDS